MRGARAVLVGSLVLAACRPAEHPRVDDAWVRLPAVPGRPAAAYLTVHGGAAPTAVIAVKTTSADRAELHESMANGMRPIAFVPVPAHGTVRFAPGGRHVMLFDVDPSVRPGGTVVLYVTLRGSRLVAASAKVVAPGDPAP